MAKTGQIKLTQYDGFGGKFIDSDYLVNSYDAGQPHKFEALMGKIFSASNRFTNKSILGMTLAKGNVKVIDNEVYRWKLAGAEEKSVRVLQNLEPNNTAPGLNFETFKIKLDEGWYGSPDVLMPEDNEYALRVVDGPVQDGNGYIYTVKLETDDPTAYLPPALLQVDKEFSKVWTSAATEMNAEFGSTYFPSPVFELESQISRFSQEVTVTDKALREDGRLGVPFKADGKRSEKFIPYAEAKMKDELYMNMEAQMKYGTRSTYRANSQSKYFTKTGPGMRQQLRDSFIEYYNGVLTESRIKDYLMSIFFARNNESDRKVVAVTGTIGSMVFHDMLAASASSFLTVDSNFITQTSKNPRHLSYGAQFTHYQGPEGIEVTVVKDPMYDDIKYCKKMHPIYTDKPIDSARFTFLDFGTSNGESNIQMLQLKDGNRHGYIPGTVTPMGPVQGGATSQKIAGYTSFAEGTAGLWIKDVTRCGEIILDVD